MNIIYWSISIIDNLLIIQRYYFVQNHRFFFLRLSKGNGLVDIKRGIYSVPTSTDSFILSPQSIGEGTIIICRELEALRVPISSAET